MPTYVAWDFTTDVATWGGSIIPLRVVRQRRWSWWYGRERLSADAARRLAAMFGPRLGYQFTQPAHPTWRERDTRILESGAEP